MAKKIRFPLEMENGVEIRAFDELRDNFSIEKVLLYVSNGKLITWLRDRYMDDVADEIAVLEYDDPELAKKVCEIFDVKYDLKLEVNMGQVEERNRKRNLLKEYTSDKKYFDVLDNIAFNQDELYDLLDKGELKIYLCGDKFNIPLSKKGMCYIGINNPEVWINSKKMVNWNERNISLTNIRFNEEYQRILESSNTESDELILKVEGVYRNTWRDTIAMVAVQEGRVRVNDSVTFKRQNGTIQEIVISDILKGDNSIESACKGEKVEVVISGLKRTDIIGGAIFEKKKKEKKCNVSWAEGNCYGSYFNKSYLNFMLSTGDKICAESCYNLIKSKMHQITYDIDNDINVINRKLLDEKILGFADEYLLNL